MSTNANSFSPTTLRVTNDDIRQRVSVVDVARRMTSVWDDNAHRGNSSDRWVCRCLCGRSEGKTPSFKLWADHAHCFSCHVHIANILQMVTFGVHHIVNFKEDAAFHRARDWLIGEFFGVGLSDVAIGSPRPIRAEPDEAPSASPEVKAILNAATDHYARVLWGDPTQPHLYPGKPDILTYLRNKRGLTDKTLRRLRAGYCDNLSLARVLHRQRLDLNLAVKIGLLTSDDRGEFMRSRIIFPVVDDGGDVIYLMGRATQGWQAKSKYLGLSQTLVRKVPMVCGHPSRGSLIVEGPVDYAVLMQWGLDAEFLLVCSLGTAHTRAIEAILTRNHPGVTFVATDQDAAGNASSGRILLGLGERFATGVRVRWRGAKDCGELNERGEQGRAAFLQALTVAEQRLVSNSPTPRRCEAGRRTICETFGITADPWPDAMVQDCLLGCGYVWDEVRGWQKSEATAHGSAYNE